MSLFDGFLMIRILETVLPSGMLSKLRKGVGPKAHGCKMAGGWVAISSICSSR